MRIVVIGAQGFIGSAFVRLLSRHDVDLVSVTRQNYNELIGIRSDIVIGAGSNSRKYLSEENPFYEFDLSAYHCLNTLRDFPSDIHVFISSVDVYDDLSSPTSTPENTLIEPHKLSFYGFHKLLSEQIVQFYSKNWLIIRLSGMVGKGLKKNPVYDILNGIPLRIHPNSLYQFINTDDAALITWRLIQAGVTREIFNVCGEGLISPLEVASLAGKEIDTSLLREDISPRIVHIVVGNQFGRLADYWYHCPGLLRYGD